MPGQPLELLGELLNPRIIRHPRFRGRRMIVRVVAQSPKRISTRGTVAIRDDGGDHSRTIATVLLVDMLDHLLAPLVLEVDVDVGRFSPLDRDEALEEQLDRLRPDGGDAQAVADDRVRGRAAALAEDVARAREL